MAIDRQTAADQLRRRQVGRLYRLEGGGRDGGPPRHLGRLEPLDRDGTQHRLLLDPAHVAGGSVAKPDELQYLLPRKVLNAGTETDAERLAGLILLGLGDVHGDAAQVVDGPGQLEHAQ